MLSSRPARTATARLLRCGSVSTAALSDVERSSARPDAFSHQPADDLPSAPVCSSLRTSQQTGDRPSTHGSTRNARFPDRRSFPRLIQTRSPSSAPCCWMRVAITDATAKLRPEDFSLDSHQRIYRVMLELLAVEPRGRLITVHGALAEAARAGRDRRPGVPGVSYRRHSAQPEHRELRPHRQGQEPAAPVARHLQRGHGAGFGPDGRSDQRCSTMWRNGSPMSRTPPFSAASPASRRSLPTPSGPSTRSTSRAREITGLATHYIEFDKMTSGLQNERADHHRRAAVDGQDRVGDQHRAELRGARQQGGRGLLARNVARSRCCAACWRAKPW